MVRYIVISILLLFSSLWAYNFMINICPKQTHYKPNTHDIRIIEDLNEKLRVHIKVLAEEIGIRNVLLPKKLDDAAEYIQHYWEKIGFEVKTQIYKVDNIACQNIIIEIPGKLKSNEIIIVGAHYDTVSNSPGANDNGSGLAALLEISRLFNKQSIDRTVRFVAFVNEEPPFFKTALMGSCFYAKECHSKNENIIGMVCLETIGYYSNKRKSQLYPFPVNFFYQDTGNFIAVVGNLKSRSLVKSFTTKFTEEIDFPVECAALFGFITGVDWSDHSSFWRYGYPAIMITDTALFRYPYYHSSQDTIDKIDFNSLAKVTLGIYKTLIRLSTT